MINDIVQQTQSDPRLQIAFAMLVVLMASMVGGIGRMIFLAFFTLRLAKLAVAAGIGITGYNLFM